MDIPEQHAARHAFAGWLDELAAPIPAPGGGAASAVVLAIGAAVTGMAVGYAPDGPDRERELRVTTTVRADAVALADRDAAASAALIAAFRMVDGETARAERARTLEEATWSSLAVAEAAAPLAATLDWVSGRGEPRLRPDVVVGARTTVAAVRSAAATARSNVASARDAGIDGAEIDRMTAALASAEHLADTLDAIAERMTDG